MTLVLCRECGVQVSSEAPTCPRCGVPQPVGVSGPVAIPGLDPDTHMWLYGQLLAGVPRQPLTRQLSESYGLPRSAAGDLVRMVEGQAVRAVSSPAAVPAGRRSSNVGPALLSLWIPGLGQMTQGRPGRGLAMFGASAVLWIILLGWVMHITAAVDAAKWDPID